MRIGPNSSIASSQRSDRPRLRATLGRISSETFSSTSDEATHSRLMTVILRMPQPFAESIVGRTVERTR